MPIAPPLESLLDQTPMDLMELYGRMRSLTNQADFTGTLPAIWQCSDESQSIKKALFGYVYNCPTFNLGRVGALLDPSRLATASHHGKDIVIFGGSHIGAEESAGIGYIERINGPHAPCCGMLARVLDDYLRVYRRATQLIKISREDTMTTVEIPYKYLFEKPVSDAVRIVIHINRLVEGEALGEGTLGKIYRLNPEIVIDELEFIKPLQTKPQPIGSLLTPDLFSFRKKLDYDSHEPKTMLEVSVFDFLAEIVAAPFPHRRLCNINTWRQFHRIASFITDHFDGSDINIFVLAGLTIDHTIRHNTVIPQFGFWMEHGRALEARYFGPMEIYNLLAEQPIYRPPVTFLEYAGL
ncbi:hypothetical protein [uncultured Desulfuromusa sp.]|uniref:hypothetical protein n=1 Tax=uncultured Desulfuromusa sp. TaxID=219183 RepID=UPI002AA7EAB7|nr:hypothetical protein [uncultured Desulfuromusa sp.]